MLNSIESICDSTPPIDILETLPRKFISPNSFNEYGDPVLFWEKANIDEKSRYKKSKGNLSIFIITNNIV